MSNRIFEQQFSATVAMAQNAKDLNTLAAQLQQELFAYRMPQPLTNTGLVIEGDGTPYGLSVKAHGIALRGHYDHVWLTKSDRRTGLGGRMRFFRQSSEGKDEQVIWTLYFDDLGNAKLGESNAFSETINPASERMMLNETFRQVALGLCNAIHASLDDVALVD